jgi:CAAX protease family protein
MKALIRRHPVVSFYGTLVLFSWAVFAAVVGPRLLRGEAMRPVDAFIMFPILVLSAAAGGLTWAQMTEAGGAGALWRRVGLWRVHLRWYITALAVPPLALLGTLGVLGAVSPEYHHGLFWWGVLFGLVPGFLEEVGWMGYLFPRLLRRFSPLGGALVLGVLWACWHLPVVNFLGAAGPHGPYFVPFFLAFAGVLVAMRVLMVWIYMQTGSVLLMQLMHASLTGSLVLLGPPHITSGGESLWYGAYAGMLWLLVAAVVAARGRPLRRARAGA